MNCKTLPYLRALVLATISTLIFCSAASAQAPTSLQYPGVNVYKTNVDNVFLAPTVSGNIVTYSISPALPAGLSFDTNTGIITGVATGAGGPITYTVTATNGSGSTNTTLSLQFFNYYYNNLNGQVSFLAANAVPKVYSSLATAGQTQGDIVLYTGVTTIGGQAIDCIVTSTIVNNVTSWNAYDQAAASGTSFDSNSDNFFSPQITYGTGGGSMTFDFQFILGGSYNNGTNTGTNVVLQNVQLNTYDIDGNGTAIQYNEFGGFNTSELGTTSNELVSFNTATGLTRYTSNTATNTVTITDPKNRIRVSYNEMSNFSIAVGANNTGLAFFFLDFSVGGAFATNATPAPSLDLNKSVMGVNNSNAGCGTTLNFTGGAGQTNAASTTNLTEFLVRFPTASIVDGANENLVLAGATSGGTIPLNFANAAVIPNVVFSQITYSVTATVANGESALSFLRASGASAFTLARGEEFADALSYQNIAASPTNGSRKFIANIRNTLFRSPDAEFTATLNCVGISGNIYHDANALTDNLVNANSTMGQFADASMYAILVDPVSNLVTKRQAIASKAFNFGTAVAGKYNIYFSNNTPPAIGSTYTASTFPAATYIATGENLGAGIGNDLLADGKLIVTVGSVTVTNANFGLQLPPTATGVNEGSSLNPGGYNYKPVTGTDFVTADADGTVTSITITGFPTNANDLKVGSTVYISGGTCPPQCSCTAWPGTLTLPYSAGSPTSSISVDPIDGATTVTIPYTATDNGTASSPASSVQVPFTVPGSPLSISGNVWNDANGDGLKNGAETLVNTAGPGQTLYALLVQTSNTYSGVNTVFASQPVSATTGYTFSNVPSGNDYIVRIVSKSSSPTDGSAESLVTPALAPNYIDVSTNNSGTITTGLSTNNPVNGAPAFSASKVNVNFGIEVPPTANSASYSIPQPAYNSVKSLTAGNSMGDLAGSDTEDGAKGSGSNIKIISVAGLNGNVLKYSGTTMAANSVISNYNPANLTVTFTGVGSLSASFTFVFIDNAGVPGTTPATYTITWSSVLAVKLTAFDARRINNSVRVTWDNNDEATVAEYKVQRSNNGTVWQDISTKTPSGAGRYYSDDMSPASGTNYYRLKITELNGVFTYSPIKKIDFNAGIRLAAWPNPVTDRLNIDSYGTTGNVKAILIDPSGRVILQTEFTGSTSLDMKNLSAGIYMMYVTPENGQAANIKIVKK